MPKTEKIRKSPIESATKFSIGNIKKGNDGNMWKIIATSSGVHRWQKITNTHSKTIKKSKRMDDQDQDHDQDQQPLKKKDPKKGGDRHVFRW